MDEKDVQHTEEEKQDQAAVEDDDTPEVEGHIKTSAESADPAARTRTRTRTRT